MLVAKSTLLYVYEKLLKQAYIAMKLILHNFSTISSRKTLVQVILVVSLSYSPYFKLGYRYNSKTTLSSLILELVRAYNFSLMSEIRLRVGCI